MADNEKTHSDQGSVDADSLFEAMTRQEKHYSGGEEKAADEGKRVAAAEDFHASPINSDVSQQDGVSRVPATSEDRRSNAKPWGRRKTDRPDAPMQTGRRSTDSVDPRHSKVKAADLQAIWEAFRAVNCDPYRDQSTHVIEWERALTLAMEQFGEISWELLPDRIYPDGTMEVGLSMSISGISRSKLRPVTDEGGRPFQQPNALQISVAREQCVADCLALFGLGLQAQTPLEAPPQP